MNKIEDREGLCLDVSWPMAEAIDEVLRQDEEANRLGEWAR